MRLVIDLGNTQIKYYVFENDQIKYSCNVFIDYWKNNLIRIKGDYPLIENCIISDVNGTFTKDLKSALTPLPFIFCSIELKIPFKTIYEPKSKLGSDRIALLSACAIEYPNKNILVIDLGSCITYDILDKKGLHHGGVISPGYYMRYKAMHKFSSMLPSLEPNNNFNLLGTNTESAMHVGVSEGINSEIIGLITKYEKKFNPLTVIFTGGDTERLSKPFKNSIFAQPNFLAKGLNYLLVNNIN